MKIDPDVLVADLWRNWRDGNREDVLAALEQDHPGLTALFLVQGSLDRQLSASDCNVVTNLLTERRRQLVLDADRARRPPAALLWVRLGDSGPYAKFDSLSAAAEYLAEHGVVPPLTRYYGTAGRGITAPGYEAADFISFYWGDADADLLSIVTDVEIKAVNDRLDVLAWRRASGDAG